MTLWNLIDGIWVASPEVGYCANGSSGYPGCGKFVFVTANTYTGNLGGVAGGNAKCQAEATAAGLPGTYKAWLSDTLGNHPSVTFTQSSIPYVMPASPFTVIANNWAQLVLGTLQNALNKTAAGGTVATGAPVWTGTNPDGTISFTSSQVCSNWTTTSGSNFTGLVGQLGGAWTVSDMNDISCSSSAALYCFQQ